MDLLALFVSRKYLVVPLFGISFLVYARFACGFGPCLDIKGVKYVLF